MVITAREVGGLLGLVTGPHQASISAPLLNKLRTFTLSTPLRAFLG